VGFLGLNNFWGVVEWDSSSRLINELERS
jgi:hypothetical protein